MAEWEMQSITKKRQETANVNLNSQHSVNRRKNRARQIDTAGIVQSLRQHIYGLSPAIEVAAVETCTDASTRDDAGCSRQSILRNRAGKRVDPPQTCSPTTVERLAPLKVCNNYYLNGKCFFNPCKHSHDPLTVEELDAVRVLARRTVCKHGTRCDVENCQAGHRCTNHETKPINTYCRFSEEMHFTDTTPVGLPQGRSSEKQ